VIMEKILFIVPPNISYDSYVKPAFNERAVVKEGANYGSVFTEMPLGLLSLSSYLKKHIKAEIKILDFNVILNKIEGFPYSSFVELFESVLSGDEYAGFKPSFIGISALFTPSYHNMLDIAAVARRLFPDSLIIAGGGVPTNMYCTIFNDSPNFDALCYGEGEKPFLALVEAKDKKDLLQSHPSWITREKVKNNDHFHHDFIEDLDEIPFFDYDLLDLGDYRLNSIVSIFPMANPKLKMPVMTSRGCPHRCCFCSSHTVHGRKMRYQSLERVREDFRRLKEKYGADIMVFYDDHLMSDKKRVYEIIAIMKELGLTAFFPSSLALYALDRKMLEALKSIGVDDLVLSVESGSSRVLKEIMHKPLDLSIVKRVVNDCRELGIASDVYVLIGLPGETKQDIEDARVFLRSIDATWIRINIATPLLGSEMLEICLQKGYLKGDYLGCDYKRAIVETADFTTEYIQEKAYELNLELNFVHNAEFRLGNYATALRGFESTIRLKNDHAFAYYWAAKCCQLMGLQEQYALYKQKYREIIGGSELWRNYAAQFELGELE
jgi:anaerobic magnesium-protoporphyrin IX monomethyl ester cyclase